MVKNKYVLMGLLSAVLVTTAVFAGDIEMKINGASDAVTIDKSDGSEAMRVTADGNVGIGTDNPEKILHIYDTNSSNIWQQIIETPHWGSLMVKGHKTSSVLLSTSTTSNKYWNIGTFNETYPSFPKDLHFMSPDNQRALVLKSNGNVGVGTTAPSQKLEVNGVISANAKVMINRGNGNTAVASDLWFDTSGLFAAENTIMLNADATGDGNGEIRFSSGTETSAATRLMTIKNDGKVGIGTTTPTQNLHLYGTDPAIKFEEDIIGSKKSYLELNANKLYFYNETDSTFPLLMDLATDNVGIGTTTPTDKLDINGGGVKIRFGTGSMEINNVVNEVANNYVRNSFLMSRNGNLTWDATDDKWYKPHESSNDFAAIIHRFTSLGFVKGGSVDLSAGITNADFRSTYEHLTILDNGNVGIGTTAPSQKLHVAGNALANAHTTPSDRRLKKNFMPIESALDKISQLNGVEYDWNAKSKREGEHDLGVIAQEVLEVFPEFVTEGSDGFYSVDYPKLTAPLIEAVKELDIQNKDQNEEIALLKSQNQALMMLVCKDHPNAEICES